MTNAEFNAVPDPSTHRWMVKWGGITLSLNDEEYCNFKRIALDNPTEALELLKKLAMNNNTKPTRSQAQFVDSIAAVVNGYLQFWGEQSGKTTARKMLSQRIMDDDT